MSDGTSEQLRNTIIEVISTLTGLEPGEIRPEDRLREDLGLDSLQSMELLSRICERYEIDVEMEDVMDVATINDVVTRLAEYVQKKTGS